MNLNGDMETICRPLDFFGTNIYIGQTVQALDNDACTAMPNGSAFTTMGWQVTPEVLYWGPRLLYERYKLPVVVTENGMANCDWIHTDGKVHDPQRIDFVARHLDQYRRAINDGVEATGYFLWSLMDNFEWSHGYKQRFGIIFVDYATGKRTPKDSAYWYRDVIASNGEMILVEGFVDE